MSAENIAQALGGRKSRWRAGWRAAQRTTIVRRAFQSGRPQMAKVLVRCHAGCEQEHVIEALRSRGLWTDRRPRSLVHRSSGS